MRYLAIIGIIFSILYSFSTKADATVPECDAFTEGSSFSANLESIQKTMNETPSWSCTLAAPTWQAINTNPIGSRPVHIESAVIDSTKPIKKILILSSKMSSAYDESSVTLFQSLYEKSSQYQFTLFNYAQNCKIRETKQLCPSADAALKKAHTDHYDLVVSMGSDTTIYLANHNFNTLPTVSACAKDPRHLGLVDPSARQRPPNMAFTSLDIDPALQIDYLQSLFLQHLKHLVIIVDSDNISSVKTQAEPLEKTIHEHHPKLTVERLNIQLQEQYKKRLEEGTLEPYLQETLYQKMDLFRKKFTKEAQKSSPHHRIESLFLITGSTELYNHISTINQHAGNIPVLSVTPSFINAGKESAFMALGVSFSRNARKAADYIDQILERNISAQDLPLGQISSPDIAINFMHLPKGFRVPFTFFENASTIYNLTGKAARCDGVNHFPPLEHC